MNPEKNSFRAIFCRVILFISVFLLLLPYVSSRAWLHGVRWLYVLVLAFVLSLFLNNIIIGVAVRLGLLDKTDSRRVHTDPTPRLGGIAVYCAFMIAILRNFVIPKELMGILVSSSVIFLLGLLDDIYGLKAFLKLAVQVLAVGILIFSGLYLTPFPRSLPGHLFLNYFLTFFWMVGIMNAVNFMDGLDGLASGLIMISSFFMFLYIFRADRVSGYFLIALFGALAGFFINNFRLLGRNDAKIFLGDSGSTFIGFLAASMAVRITWADKNSLVSLTAPVIILSIPIFDMIYTTISRFRNGSVKTLREWIEFVGKDHLHHRLLNIGFNKFAAVLFIFLLQLCLSILAIVIKRADTVSIYLSFLMVISVFMIVVILMLTGRRVTSGIR